MKNNIFAKRPSLVEVIQKVEDVVDQTQGRTYKIVNSSTCHLTFKQSLNFVFLVLPTNT